MAYLSLNRRWRPRSFSEVSGQEHVTRTLANAISQNRVAQAYLFGGRRGTGKTTMARLLAMSLNCQAHDAPTTEPCGKCASCQSIVASTSPDVIELDAASNRGIDEIRALQENVRLSPMAGRYKVYIIDEAHQMTKEAYNAFLKTLEEPPAHVVFVLATTEPEKILPTVRSRCQRFDFRPLPEPKLVGRLKTVAQAEGVEAPEDLLAEIARKADGSARDALGLLEQCVAFAGNRPTLDDFLTVSGGLDVESLGKLAALVRGGQAAEALIFLDNLIRSGRDPSAIAAGLVSFLRDLLLASLKGGPAAAPAGGASAAVAPAAGSPTGGPPGAPSALDWPRPLLVRYLNVLSRADSDMRYSTQPRLLLEMALLGLASDPSETAPAGAAPLAPASSQPAAPPSPRPATSTSPRPAVSASAGPGLSAIPGQAAPTPSQPPARPASAETTPDAAKEPPPPVRSEATGSCDLKWFRDNWDNLMNRVKAENVFVRAFLLKAQPAAYSDGALTLAFDGKFHKEQMEDDKNRKVLEKVLSEATGMAVIVRCRLSTVSAEASASTQASGPGTTSGPASGSAGAVGTGSGPAVTGQGPAKAGQGPTPAGPGPAKPSHGPAKPGQGPAPAGPARTTPAQAGPGPRPGAAPVVPGSDAVRSALTIFGGRVVEEGKPRNGLS